MRVDNLEFRNMGGTRSPEIVAWKSYEDSSRGEEFCYTLLWWKKDREGYYIEFVSDRPLNEDNQETLMKLMKYGQAVLTAEFKLLED
jgi:hypothetical protein